jgi:uncharacterized membrane protein YccC
MDFFNVRFIFIVGICAAVLCMGTGCGSAPAAVGGSEEIGRLRSAYSELERRYNELQGDYSDLIQRQAAITAEQQRLIEEQSETADRIGNSIFDLTERTGSVNESVREISANNREAVNLIQRYIERVSRQGQNYSGHEGKEPDIFPVGDNIDSGGGTDMAGNNPG